MTAVYPDGSPVVPLDGGAVVLRPFHDGDVADLVAGCNDPLVRRFLPELPRPYTPGHAAGWIGDASLVFARGGAAFAVADPVAGRLLGGVGLDRLVPERAQGEVGYWTGPWARGRGVATAAVRTLAQWAEARGLARLELLTDWANVASQRVAGAAGFRGEGERRGAAGAAGDRRDLLAFARLAGDPAGPAPRPVPDLPGGELTDGVVRLRPLGEGDAGFAAELHAVPDVAAWHTAPQRWETERRCARAGARWLAGTHTELVIEDAATRTPAGEIQLSWPHPAAGEAALGYLLLPAWRGLGLATRAVRLLSLWAFAETGSGRLVATTLPDNLASRRVLERAGMSLEGRPRAALRAADGSLVDGLRYALVAGDLLRTVRDGPD